MDKIVIEGGNRLTGDVTVSGAKNAVLPLMAASLLVDGSNTITNVPNLRDIATMIKLLHALGAKAHYESGAVVVRPGGKLNPRAPYKLVSTMRASVCGAHDHQLH